MTGQLLRDYEQEAVEAGDCYCHFVTPGNAFDLEGLRKRACLRLMFMEVCESPIEVLLAVEIYMGIKHVLEERGLRLVAQHEWQRYRIDLAIMRGFDPVLFIECDGKKFHSSDGQIAQDRRKDAAAVASGIQLIRFSGSEIYRSADGCVHRILEHLVRGGAV